MRSLHPAQHLLGLSDDALTQALLDASRAYARAHQRLAETAQEAGRLGHHRRHTQEALRGRAQASTLTRSPVHAHPILAAARFHLQRILEGAPIPDQPLLCLVEPTATNEIAASRDMPDHQPEFRR